jgi:hypothetical protein
MHLLDGFILVMKQRQQQQIKKMTIEQDEGMSVKPGGNESGVEISQLFSIL